MPPAGDSAVTQTWHTLGYIKKAVLDVTFDSGDGSFTSTALSQKIEGFILRLVTDPGATAPDDNYDITVTDAKAVDVLQSLGVNRDTSTTENVNIVYAGTADHPPVAQSDTLTLNISGNTAVSATTQITLYWCL